MYLGNIGGYGTSDFNKALKGTNIAAIEKGLAFQRKQLSKRKSKDKRGIEADTAQIAAAEARLAELRATAVAPPPTVPQVATSPAAPTPVPVTVSPIPQAAPPVTTVAPLPAAESFATSLAPVPSLFTPAPAATPDTATAAPAAPASNMPLILGAAGLGFLALMFLGKKKRG